MGTFEHDNDGKYELEATFRFMDKGEVVYYFNLYYSDKEPVGRIKFFDCGNFEMGLFDKFGPLPAIEAPTTGGNK